MPLITPQSTVEYQFNAIASGRKAETNQGTWQCSIDDDDGGEEGPCFFFSLYLA